MVKVVATRVGGIPEVHDRDFLGELVEGSDHEVYAEALGRQLEAEKAVLFGEKEGKIAFSNRGKEPLYLFAAMQRHLNYPPVPRLVIADETPNLVPKLLRRIEQLESRVKLIEQEQRQGIDITQFYEGPKPNQET